MNDQRTSAWRAVSASDRRRGTDFLGERQSRQSQEIGVFDEQSQQFRLELSG